MTTKPKYNLKLAILGDKQVGKTSLLTRYTHDSFNSIYLHTKGGDITEKVIEQQKRILHVTIIDSAGHNYVRSLIKTLYRDVHGIMLVFDVTKRTSFEALDKWMHEINLVNTCNPDIVMVANKTDLKDFSQVPTEEYDMYAQRNELDYIECSAKTGLNVAEAFNRLLEKTSYNKIPTDPNPGLRLPHDPSEKDIEKFCSCCGTS